MGAENNLEMYLLCREFRTLTKTAKIGLLLVSPHVADSKQYQRKNKCPPAYPGRTFPPLLPFSTSLFAEAGQDTCLLRPSWVEYLAGQPAVG